MQIDSEQLARHLERQLAPLYVVHGDEPLLAIEAADRIRARARAEGYAERDLLIAESGFDWRQLWATGASLSLFSARRIVEVRLPTASPGTEGAEALIRYAAALPEDTLTLVVLSKVERRTRDTKWFAALETSGVSVQAQRVSLDRLPGWLAGRLAAQGQKAGPEVLDYLAAHVEGNLLAAHQEVQKLALLFPPGPLELEDVRGAVTDVARYDAFGLGPAVLSGDPVHVLRMLDGLRGEGTGLPLVLWALAEEARAMLRIALALEQGAPIATAMRDAKVWGDRARLMPRAVRRLTLPALRQALAHAAAIDRINKGAAPGNAWDELRALALRLTAPERSYAPAP
ncbi:MAG: DNA polymerase III subunit delta [Betaproteobacteria bacterium]|nr:DNA polymerase III subunit delta [Betaproteobacteria bacterium]